jgi:rhodanese-related sulfurtransferase
MLSRSTIFYLLMAGLLLTAQTGLSQVESDAYGVMLRTLLSHNVPEINVRDAARDSASILFLDARETNEYQVSHLFGALHVGYDRFHANSLSQIPRNQRLVVYCSVGYRSEKVTEKLRNAGFTNVSNLYGGIFEWVNQGYPVYREGKQVRQVHAYDRVWGVWLNKGTKVY